MGSQLESVSLYFNRKSVVRFRENSRHYILILRVIIYYKLTCSRANAGERLGEVGRKGQETFLWQGFSSCRICGTINQQGLTKGGSCDEQAD